MTDLSAARLARLAVEALPTDSSVTFPAPRYHGGTTTVSWDPETALAVAGHICQHWGHGIATRRVTVEHERSFVVTLRHEEWYGTYRLRVRKLPEGPQLTELCGHDGCDWEAPAGPGSRCAFHTTDPVPAGKEPTYWGRIAAEAWAAKHNPQGERGRLADNERNGVIIGGIRAGLKKKELHQITGIARTTIDRILDNTLGYQRELERKKTSTPVDAAMEPEDDEYAEM